MQLTALNAFLDNYIWLFTISPGIIGCVDPGDAQPVMDYLHSTKQNLGAILLTHHHQDHVGGVGDLIKAFPSCLIYAPDDTRISYKTNIVVQGSTVKLGSFSFEVLFNPGHTSSHISYFDPHHKILFCGDTLFSGGCGRVFDGTMEELHQSLLLFKSLPAETKVYCAHEYTLQNLDFAQAVEPNNQDIKQSVKNHQGKACTLPSTIAMEQRINPFMRTNNPTVIAFAQQHGAPNSSSLEVFRSLRNAKNSFK